MCTINRWVRVLVMLSVFALLAAACGGDDEAEDTTTTSAATTTTAAAGATTTTGGEDTTEPPAEPAATGMAGLQVIDDLTFTDEQCDRFIDRFIHEYFAALGLAYLSPYGGEMTATEDGGAMVGDDLAEAKIDETPLD